MNSTFSGLQFSSETVLLHHLNITYGVILINCSIPVDILVYDTKFYNSDRPVAILCTTGRVKIDHCIFSNNTSLFGGSVLHVKNSKNMKIMVDNSQFLHNKVYQHLRNNDEWHCNHTYSLCIVYYIDLVFLTISQCRLSPMV